MSWLKEVIGTEKAIIAMCHFAPLPGDPGFRKAGLAMLSSRTTVNDILLFT